MIVFIRTFSGMLHKYINGDSMKTMDHPPARRSLRALMAFGRGSTLLTAAAFVLAQGVMPVAAQSVNDAPEAAVETAAANVPATPSVQVSPLASGLRAAFSDRGDISAFYASRGFEPLWLGEAGRAASEALLAVLTEADRHALPTRRYKRDEMASRRAALQPGSLQAQTAFEADMTRIYLQYARDVSSGALEPNKIDREILVYPERRTAMELLSGLARSAQPGQWFETLPPQSDDYRRLVERYRSFRLMAETGGWGPILTKRSTLRPGQRSSDVGALRERLTAMGYFAPATASVETGVVLAAADRVSDAPSTPLGDPLVYDEGLVQAVKLFQERHGLNQDGAVGPATRAALNVEPSFRAQQIAVNLERMRWLNRDLGAKHILVNLASFDMAVIENGAPVFESRVVVGKSKKHRTPEFSDQMEHMVVNPTWYVPYSIASQEILPKIKQDPGYLARKNMRLHGADVWSVDWSQVTSRNFPGRITQGPRAEQCAWACEVHVPERPCDLSA